MDRAIGRVEVSCSDPPRMTICDKKGWFRAWLPQIRSRTYCSCFRSRFPSPRTEGMRKVPLRMGAKPLKLCGTVKPYRKPEVWLFWRKMPDTEKNGHHTGGQKGALVPLLVRIPFASCRVTFGNIGIFGQGERNFGRPGAVQRNSRIGQLAERTRLGSNLLRFDGEIIGERFRIPSGRRRQPASKSAR